MIKKCVQDFAAANFRCEEEFLRRFVAALLAKRFVILTGLAGSGKTKLAQAFARWATPLVAGSDPYEHSWYRIFRRDAMKTAAAPEKPMPAYVHPENLIDWLMLV